MNTSEIIVLLEENSSWKQQITSSFNYDIQIMEMFITKKNILFLRSVSFSCIVIIPIEIYLLQKTKLNELKGNPNLYIALSLPNNPNPNLQKLILRDLKVDYISRSLTKKELVNEINYLNSISADRKSKLLSKIISEDTEITIQDQITIFNSIIQ